MVVRVLMQRDEGREHGVSSEIEHGAACSLESDRAVRVRKGCIVNPRCSTLALTVVKRH